jgi:hypothetical protein
MSETTPAVTFLSIMPPGLFQIFGRIIGNESGGSQPQLNLDDGRVGQGWIRPKGILDRPRWLAVLSRKLEKPAQTSG